LKNYNSQFELITAKRAQINTIGDLLNYSPEKLQKLKNFGRKSADEVFMKLKNKLGIILK